MIAYIVHVSFCVGILTLLDGRYVSKLNVKSNCEVIKAELNIKGAKREKYESL